MIAVLRFLSSRRPRYLPSQRQGREAIL